MSLHNKILPVFLLGLLALTVRTNADDTTKDKWQTSIGDEGLIKSTDLNFAKSTGLDDFLQSGTLSSVADLQMLLHRIVSAADQKNAGAYVIHVLQWQKGDKAVNFEKWYVYDSTNSSKDGFYLQSDKDILARKFIQGQTHIIFVAFYLRSDPDGPAAISAAERPILQKTAAYSIQISKTYSTLRTELVGLASILGWGDLATAILEPGQAAATPQKAATKEFEIGYAAYTPLPTVPYPVSSIAFTSDFAAAGGAAPTPSAAVGANATPTTVTSTATFTDEPPTPFDISAAYPVTSYKDVTYQQTANGLVPNNAKQQNVYATFDIYAPPVEPQLVATRWIPHLFVGLPLGGKVLDHPMGGIAIGLKYAQLFYGDVADFQNQSSKGQRSITNRGVFGIKISISTVSGLFKKSQ
jgi:hypothetical protein